MSDDKSKSGTDDSQAKPGTDEAGKGKTGLQALLEDYDRQIQKVASKQDESTAKELAALREEVKELRSAEAGRTYRKEMDENLIPAVKGDLEVHPKVVERWLNEQAASDPRLEKVWNERFENPEAFEEAIDKLKPKFKAAAEEEGLIGKSRQKPKDDKGLAAALRSSRTTPTGTTDFGDENLAAMSDTDFALHKAEVLRAFQAGQLQ